MVAIRAAVEADLAAICDLLRETWHDTYDGLLGRERVAALSARFHAVDRLAGERARTDHAFLVAEAQGTIIGTASATWSRDGTLVIDRLYVRPNRQRGGVGATLLAALIAAAPVSPSRLRVEAEAGNRKAKSFYERHGFLAAGAPKPDEIGMAASFLRYEGLRPARSEDAQDLFGLLALCFAEYPGCYVDPHEDLTDLRDPGSSFAAKGGVFLVAEDERGRVSACVAVDFPADGSAELHRLYVRPDQRGHGLGARLVGEMEFFARTAGATRMVFWSDTRFTVAHRLYRRLGYAEGAATRDLGDISHSVEHFFARDLTASARDLNASD